MPYTSNPHAAKARMRARYDVLWHGLTTARAANKYGVNRSTIQRWLKKSSHCNAYVYTRSSAPKHHPNQLKVEIVNRIIELRTKLRRCAPVIHAHLRNEGFEVSLSSVTRTLRRQHLTRKKRQAKEYVCFSRPRVLAPGSLVQVDTIHFVHPSGERTYVYAVIDLFSRLGYAEYHQNISHQISFRVIKNAQRYFGFDFQVVQADNGSEFCPGLGYLLRREKMALRHSRVRKPNDNAHVERFIRTIQEECFRGRLPENRTTPKLLREYIFYYNQERLHLSLDCQTPARFVAKVLT